MSVQGSVGEMQELESIFEDLLAQVPVEEQKELVLNAAVCPQPPLELVTDRLKVLALGMRTRYGESAWCDTVDFFADKTTYRRLGLLLFSSVFHPNRQVTLLLRHPNTEVTRIRIECSVDDVAQPSPNRLVQMPVAYGYWGNPVEARHPMSYEDWRVSGHRAAPRASYDLPYLQLTNEDGCCVNEEQVRTRDVVDGFGGPDATVTLAKLLLDIGLPQTELTEFDLESPAGYWGVAIGSAEMRLWVGYKYH